MDRSIDGLNKFITRYLGPHRYNPYQTHKADAPVGPGAPCAALLAHDRHGEHKVQAGCFKGGDAVVVVIGETRSVVLCTGELGMERGQNKP